jgi:hypothetical protein
VLGVLQVFHVAAKPPKLAGVRLGCSEQAEVDPVYGPGLLAWNFAETDDISD